MQDAGAAHAGMLDQTDRRWLEAQARDLGCFGPGQTRGPRPSDTAVEADERRMENVPRHGRGACAAQAAQARQRDVPPVQA